MFGDGSLTFREFVTREPLPLATVHDTLLDFLRGRDDAVLCGAHAVNAYVDEPRMSQDIDLLSPCPKELVDQISTLLMRRFRITVRVQQGRNGGFRLYQARNCGERQLVDVRAAEHLPPVQRVADVLVVAPAELIARKVIASERHKLTPKLGIDLRDVVMLLLTFPELKSQDGPVRERLMSAGASPEVYAAWDGIVAQEFLPEDEDTGY
jgi:hypothetical protein